MLFVFFLIPAYTMPQSGVEEYSVKAAFLYNFTKYIEWEDNSGKDNFIIGIVGDSPLIKYLNQFAEKKTVNGRKIIIEHYGPENIGSCNILFISNEMQGKIRDILLKIPNNNTLVVSETENPLWEGTCINFVTVNSKIKFEIDAENLQKRNLKISSELLKLSLTTNRKSRN